MSLRDPHPITREGMREPRMQALIIDREHSSPLLPGFLMSRKALARDLGFRFEIAKAESLDAMATRILGAGSNVNAVIATLERCDPTGQVMDIMEAVRKHRPDLAVAVMDAHDNSVSNHFGVLPYVDAFLSPNPMRPRWLYQDEYAGGTPLTELLNYQWDLDLGDWEFGESPEPTLAFYRIIAMWSSGINPGSRRLLRWGRLFGRRWDQRGQDLYRRLPPLPDDPRCHHVGTPEWQRVYRRMCWRKLSALQDTFRCGALPKTSRARSVRELLQSRIAVSGFGGGEILQGDFDAICCGALLVKPAVTHLEIYPELFVDYETYVPIRWDMADLESVCAFYLERPEDAQRIIANAQAALARFFAEDGVTRRVEALLPLLTRRFGGEDREAGSRKRFRPCRDDMKDESEPKPEFEFDSEFDSRLELESESASEPEPGRIGEASAV